MSNPSRMVAQAQAHAVTQSAMYRLNGVSEIIQYVLLA